MTDLLLNRIARESYFQIIEEADSIIYCTMTHIAVISVFVKYEISVLL